MNAGRPGVFSPGPWSNQAQLTMNQPLTSPHVLGKEPVTIDLVTALSDGGPQLGLAKESYARLKGSVDKLQRLIDSGAEVYGVTTGFGDSCETSVPQEDRLALARNLMRFHGCGVGRPFARHEGRAILVARVATLVRGHSAVRPEVVEGILALLNHDITPVIPAQGSVGASGDLTPLSYVAAVLSGERDVWFRGARVPALSALETVGLKPLVLRPKESLAIMNGTSAMTGLAALAFRRARRLARWASTLTAAVSDVVCGRPEHFADRIFELKPHPGQRQCAAWVRAALHPTRQGNPRIQDRYSIRCAPHVIGVLLDELPHMKQTIETELNGVNDNPIFDFEDESDDESLSVYHGGNFYGGHICQVMDTLKTCVANVADLLDRQLLLCCHPATNHGLAANLVGAQPSNAHHGFKAMQITTSALVAEACKLTMPASVFSRSTENHNQDKVSMGTIAARDCLSILDMAEQVAAIHSLAVAQAADLRGLEECGPGLRQMHRVLRAHVAFNDCDRAMEGDIQRVLDTWASSDSLIGDLL